MKFEELTLNNQLIRKICEYGFNELTQIQQRCLPEILKGRDVVGQAETGSGKTLAFCLPIVDKIIPGNGIQALVLTPTRELCVQVTTVFHEFGKPLGIQATSVYGGVKIQPQMRQMQTSDVVIGTPGRILDHLRRRTLDLRHIRFLVLDETDKMFEMGFIDDVEAIIQQIPQKRQTLMFSATIVHGNQRLLMKHLNNPVVVNTKSYVDKNKLQQVYYDIYQRHNKFSLLVHLLRNHTSGLAIVFCATRKESDIVSKNLRRQGINASAIHGGMSQQKRLQSLNALRNQKTEVLVATDLAARGLDIKNVTHIYHYDVPKTSTEYIHRIGRTARAGENGSAVTLLTERDHENFRRVQGNEELDIRKASMPHFKKIPFIRQSNKRKTTYREKRSYSYG